MLWRCENCGGPAKWTIIAGAAYTHCLSGCEDQLELDMEHISCYVDRVVSVSALAEAEDGSADELPF